MSVKHPVFSSLSNQSFGEIFNTYNIHGLRFIRTSTGGMGLAYGDLQPGDEVWNIHGAKAPLILRPERNSSPLSLLTTYKFIGPAWVLDMMEGEVWNDMNAYAESKRSGVPFISKSGFTERQVEQWEEKEFLLA